MREGSALQVIEWASNPSIDNEPLSWRSIVPTAAPDAVALTAMIASLPLMLTRRTPPSATPMNDFTSKNFLVGTSPTQYGNLLLLGTPNQTDAVNIITPWCASGSDGSRFCRDQCIQSGSARPMCDSCPANGERRRDRRLKSCRSTAPHLDFGALSHLAPWIGTTASGAPRRLIEASSDGAVGSGS